MPIYRVKPGLRHGINGKYGPGDTVELTEVEAKGFEDKLELIGGLTLSAGDGASLFGGGNFATIRFDLHSAIAAASDDELLEVPGISKRNLAQVRSWAGGGLAITGGGSFGLGNNASTDSATTTGLKDGEPVATDTVTLEQDGGVDAALAFLGNPPGQ